MVLGGMSMGGSLGGSLTDPSWERLIIRFLEAPKGEEDKISFGK